MRVNGRLRRAAAGLAMAAALTVVVSGCTAEPRAEAQTPAQVTGDLPADTVSALQAAVEQAMAAAGAPGAIVGVWAPWAGAWVTGLGETAPGSGEAVTTDMAFRATTMTRPMICDVLYGLVDDGVVELDDPVSKWVPSSPDLDKVTLRHLCDNVSGLSPSQGYLLPSELRTPRRVWNPREVAAAGLGRPSTEPGVAVTLSDTGFILLGLALQNATNETPAALIKRYVADPLGLQRTRLPGGAAGAPGSPALPGFRSDADDIAAGCAAPAEYTEISATYASTDGGVVSTISELGVYAQSLAARVKDDSGDVDPRWGAAKPVDPAADSWNQYAGGTYLAGPLVGEQGSLPGYMTSAYADTDSGLAVAVVLNNSAASASIAGNLAKELASIVSKAPARAGEKAPASGLPWSAEDQAARILASAICPVDTAE
ncbi:serine hydrolase domain-containing protein [Microbacterium phosphatis]|uniref:serine hydrolase domain-containing protein n=1 Tax=Microbacterium phosphatis TaxID=3140248 RepID=UPI0031408B17